MSWGVELWVMALRSLNRVVELDNPHPVTAPGRTTVAMWYDGGAEVLLWLSVMAMSYGPEL